MRYPQFAQLSSHYLEEETPFFFAVDFEKESWFLLRPQEAAEKGILYSLNGHSNAKPLPHQDLVSLHLLEDQLPELKRHYQKAFTAVQKQLNWGNSFLLNLTFPVEVHLDGSLEEVFWQSHAPFKLYWKGRFTVFSPESFVRIRGNQIETFPMKGTRPADKPGAAQELLEDHKEKAEHATIVDLLRNDLSQFAHSVRVERYRYIEEIQRQQGGLLQSSTHIKGELPNSWKSHFAHYLDLLLPAGSVSGAPKPQTLEIIRNTETDSRGFYSGVFGVFDGTTIQSAVAIRFLELKGDKVYYRAGGGITHLSQFENEFDELLQKVYLPTL